MKAARIRVRPFRAEDLDAVASLARETLGDDAPSTAQLARDFLLDPGFALEDLLIAEQGARPAGFLLGPRLRPPTPADDASQYRTLWIAAFGVRPDRRRRGIATALLQRALDAAARDDLWRVDVADFPVRYLVPGIDPVASAAAHSLLVDRFGFRQRDSVASMGIELAGLPERQDDGGRQIRRLDAGEIPLVRDFLRDAFGWSWWLHMARALDARLAGAATPGDILVAWDGGVPVGVVHHNGARFGPLAVAERARGRGLGTRLTQAALAGMRDQGLGRAHFLIADAPAERFYGHLGFTVLRRFERLTLELTPVPPLGAG